MGTTSRGPHHDRSSATKRHSEIDILLPEHRLQQAPLYQQTMDKIAANATSLSSVEVLQLQCIVGNQAMSRCLGARPAPKIMPRPERAEGTPRGAPESSLASSGASFEVGKAFERRLAAAKLTGDPLEHSVRAYMEPRFGVDFGGVRVHTGSEAAQLNRSVSAQAFTHGSDIYMNQGKYAPGTTSGLRLLAHELAHVVQQEGSGIRRIMRWGGATKHNEVTAEAFARDETLNKMYSKGAQSHLGTMSDKMDRRLAFFWSFLWGGNVPGPKAYKQWADNQRQVELNRIGNMTPDEREAFLNSVGQGKAASKKIEAEYEEMIAKKSTALKSNKFKEGLSILGAGDTLRDWRIAASKGRGPKKLPVWALQRDKRVQIALREHLKRIGDPRHDPKAYDNMIVKRIEGEPENHAEGGRYRLEMQGSARAKSAQRVQMYLDQAVAQWNEGNHAGALQSLGLGLHTAEDRGAHGDGVIGFGHDPRRLTKPPIGALTADAYRKEEQPWKGEYCDDKTKNPIGFEVGVMYAQQLLKEFLVRTVAGRKGLGGKVRGTLADMHAPLSTLFGGGAIRPGKMKFSEGVDDPKEAGGQEKLNERGPEIEAQFERLQEEQKKIEERKVQTRFHSQKVQNYVERSQYKGFRTYMEKQGKEAPLRLWRAIHAYQRSGDRTVALVIYKTYLTEGARRPAGIDKGLVKEIKETLDYYKSGSGIPAELWKKDQLNLFAKIKQPLAEIIMDTHHAYQEANPTFWELFERGLRKK
jgi:hypothetical protein